MLMQYMRHLLRRWEALEVSHVMLRALLMVLMGGCCLAVQVGVAQSKLHRAGGGADAVGAHAVPAAGRPQLCADPRVSASASVMRV